MYLTDFMLFTQTKGALSGNDQVVEGDPGLQIQYKSQAFYVNFKFSQKQPGDSNVTGTISGLYVICSPPNPLPKDISKFTVCVETQKPS